MSDEQGSFGRSRGAPCVAALLMKSWVLARAFDLLPTYMLK